MHPITTVLEIVRLLKEGDLSQREIAARLRVSRTVVAAIASGRRGAYGREQEPKTTARQPPKPRPLRCPGCGGLVIPPCRLCRARRHRLNDNPPRKAA